MSNQQSLPNIPVGTVIAGKYRVERILGQGGMGVVVAARHIDLHATFAIKLMRATELSNPQAVERFLREARAALELKKKSQHVVQVHDVGRLESGEPYIVMELLQGEDLAEALKRRGPLPIDEACLHIVQACDALAEAHAMGIIHRDLKPGNLFLTRLDSGKSFIKVLDFGISKHTIPSGDAPEVEMTGTRDVMGSPLYMSPEQMRSARQVDARSDIWSLGAILYRLLTGKAPFQASTMPEIFAAVLDGKPPRPPSSYRAEIPKQLDATILRCLEKTPLRRYGRVSDLLVALAPFTPGNRVDGDDEGEEALTLLRPPTKPVDLSGTLPMSQEDLRAAARAAAGRPRPERNGTQQLPALQPEARSDAASRRPPPSSDTDGPHGTQPLDRRDFPHRAGSPAAQPSASAGLSRKTIPMRAMGGPHPSPLPEARSPSGEWRAPASQGASPPPPMQRRPSFTGEVPAGLLLQPPPMPAAVPPSPPQRRPSFAGDVMSPLASPMQPLAQSSSAWQAPPPRPSMSSQPLAQVPGDPAPLSAPTALGQSSSGVFVAPPISAPLTVSSTTTAAAPPVGEMTGPSMAPWGSTQSRIPRMDGRHRKLVVGGISFCVLLALVVTVARSRSTGAAPATASAGSTASATPLPLPSTLPPATTASPLPSGTALEIALDEAPSPPPPPPPPPQAPARPVAAPTQQAPKSRTAPEQPTTKAGAARPTKATPKGFNPFEI